MNKHNDLVGQSNILESISVICLLTIVSLSAIILSSPPSYSESANASVIVGSACSISANVVSAHTAEVPAGSNRTEIGTTNIKTICNDAGGFAIYAIGYTDNEFGNNKMTTNSSAFFNTGTATSGANSAWSMKLAQVTTGTYATTIDNGYTAYSNIPATYTKVAHMDSVTDPNNAATLTGSTISLTYASYISTTQDAGTYNGQVKFTLVNPSSATPAQPQPSTPGYINYYANASNAVGTMGRQFVSDGNTVQLYASNFSRDGYGFAGWSDAYDYATNPNAHFYGPNEDIAVPTGTTANGLALYAVWIKSAGIMQANAQSVCNSLTAATYNNEGDSDESTWSITAGLSSISALTDTRDDQTYAIAKLTDGKCWMIENLRLADKDSNNNDVILSSANTNNPSLPLTNIYDTSSTSNHLSPTSSVAYNASTAPEGWCTTFSAACDDQSRLRTDNTANRVTFASTSTSMSSHDANFYSYGNYYNWYSATAGNGTYSKSSGNTSGDICPAGWHLPTGHFTSGSASGESGLLSNSLGGYKNASNVAQLMDTSSTPTSTIMSKRLRHFPNNLLYSGRAGDGASLSARGGIGGFWSSTASSNSSANEFNVSPYGVNPGTSSTATYTGRTVRCVASPST